MGDSFFDLHKYPYDGVRISSSTFYAAQNNKAKLQPRFSSPLTRGEERSLTATQRAYLMNCITGNQLSDNKANNILFMVLAVCFIFWLLIKLHDSMPDNPLAAFMISFVFLAIGVVAVFFLRKHNEMLAEAINTKQYKVYAYNLDEKKWSVRRDDDSTDYRFYLQVNGIYVSVDSDTYMMTRIDEPIFGVVITTEKGNYFYLVPGIYV